MRYWFYSLIIFLLCTNTGLAQTGFGVPYDICPDQGPTNMISFQLLEPGPVKLVVEHVFTNIHVRTLLDDNLAQGTHSIAWDGKDDSGQPLETGIYVIRLSGDGWQVASWSAIDCGTDAAIQSRVIIGGQDVIMGLTIIIEDTGSTELGVFTADGAVRVKDFSYLNNSHYAFFSWAFEDTAGNILPAGDYLYRMVSASYSEDIPFTIDPINRGALSVTVTDGDGSLFTGISGVGDAPLVKGPLQQLEIDFGRAMSADEISYILDGGLVFSGALAWANPILPTVHPDSTGVIFSSFDMSRNWRDVWGMGSITGYGLFEPFDSRFQFGFDHEGYTRTDHFCDTMGDLDLNDWVINPGPFYFAPSGTMMPPCDNPIPPGQYASIEYSTDTDGPVVIIIIDSSGNLVRRLVHGYMSAGYHSVYWDRLDDDGAEVPEGLYHLIWDAGYDDGGQVITSGDIYVSNAPSSVPNGSAILLEPALSGNHPNPFNPETTISFHLPSNSYAEIAVLSLDGKRVKTLLSAEMAAGQHSISWNGRDSLGRTVPSGTYFYRLQAGTTTDTRRMLLLK